MTSYRFAIPACAALAIAVAGCSGGPSASTSNDADAIAQDNGAAALANAADGSAARAVGDMMSDPAVRAQMGLAPSSAPATPPATPDGEAVPGVAASDAMDPTQTQALAMCRILRGGTPRAVTQTDLSAARTDLAADPDALGRCHAGM